MLLRVPLLLVTNLLETLQMCLLPQLVAHVPCRGVPCSSQIDPLVTSVTTHA